MHSIRNPSEMAFCLWSYFYLENEPRAGEHEAWLRIEEATAQIRASVDYLGPGIPPRVRLQNARHVRRGVRRILALVPKLESVPDPWTAEALAYLEVAAEHVMEEVEPLDLTVDLH